jgi:2-amino-4-hydroxy-6-hydroxymethyldihydropteridine diphosphokinase
LAGDFPYPRNRGSICYLGIGSNMGDPELNCREAAGRISGITGVKLLRTSSLYRTEPVGMTDQPWFINAAAEIRSYLTPGELLQALKDIEKAMGRETVARWGPRIIDIDILLFGQEIIDEDNLVIPHPEFHKRRFALLPLNELAPYAIHPAFGVSIKGLLERVEDSSTVVLTGKAT